MNVPDPHHWTLNSCFSVFRNVWVHSGPFHYCTKLGAKWAELVQLMQKFMPWSRVGIFRYSSCHEVVSEFFATNAPDPHHWTLNSFLLHYVKFGCICDRFPTALNSVKNGPNWCHYCKSSCHEVVSELFATNAPDWHHWTLNSCFVAFRKVWVHLGSFRYFTKLGAKWAELV